MAIKQNKNDIAQPFLKWAGGKRYILPAIKPYIPEQTDIYWEPFLGGGAVFFSIKDQVGIAHLSDTNDDLINTYKIIQTQPQQLIERLIEHVNNHVDDQYYYEIRSQHAYDSSIGRAARFIYLNRTCFNGLYRVNLKGEFNVPKGKYANPNICDTVNLYHVHDTLQAAFIKQSDFKSINPSQNDFVYCDPPYDGVYGSYSPGGFTYSDQERLRNCSLLWHEHGARIMLTNADTPYIRSLYADKPFVIAENIAPTSISGNPDNRRVIRELIIMTYA